MLKPMRWKQRGQTQGAGLLNGKRNRHLLGSSVLSSLQGQNIGHCPAPWMVRRARDHRSDFIYRTEIPSAFQCLGSWLPPFQKHAPSLCLSTKPWVIVYLQHGTTPINIMWVSLVLTKHKLLRDQEPCLVWQTHSRVALQKSWTPCSTWGTWD